MSENYVLGKTRTKQPKSTKNKRSNIFGGKHRNRTKRNKKMSCSPLVEGQTADKSTCYTDKILFEIRDAFNREHPTERIKSDTPKEVLNQLREKMSNSCNKEKCWLKLLSNQHQRVIDEFVFAPEKPIEWKNNPYEWLSNFDILKVLKQYEKKYRNFKFIGPTPIDFDARPADEGGKCVWEDLCHFDLNEYISRNFNKIGIIFNLQKHDKDGSHWVSLFIDIENSFIFYFDSASNPTPKEIKVLIERIREQSAEGGKEPYAYYENYPNNHQRSNTECGMYSLYFIITMVEENKSIKNKIKLFKERKIPDKKMRKLRDHYFS